jgi:hypothetical protein
MPKLKVKHSVAPSLPPNRDEIIAAKTLPHFLAERGDEKRHFSAAGKQNCRIQQTGEIP